MIRVDLHLHTRHSADSTTSPRELVRRARTAGLNRVAVTDHGAIGGAVEAKSIDSDLVIVGEEIKCRCGTHIIGLFLDALIPERLSVAETVQRIREQGGVVYAPHPFSYLRKPSTRAARAIAVADVVEIFNARGFVPAWNRRARAAAQFQGLPGFAGSDAHFPREIGRVHTAMPDFGDAESFLEAARAARIGTARIVTPLVHVASFSLETARRMLPLRYPNK